MERKRPEEAFHSLRICLKKTKCMEDLQLLLEVLLLAAL